MTASARSPPPEPDLRWAIGAVRRRLWPIAGFIVVGTVVTAALSLQLTPRFSVKATVLLDPRQLRLVEAVNVRSEPLPVGAVLRTELALLRSRPFLVRVVERLDLASDPAFNGTSAARRDWQRWPLEAWRDLRDSLWTAPPTFYPTSDNFARASAVATLERALTVQNPEDSYLIDIGVRGPDAERVAAIANTAAGLYVDDRHHAQQAARQRASQWLRRRLPQLAAVAEVAERAVADHAQAHGLVMVAGVDLNDQQMIDLEVELALARADLSASRALADMVRQGRRGGGDLASMAEVGASPVIVALRLQEAQLRRQEGEFRTLYGDRHPRMRELQRQADAVAAKVGTEVARVARQLDNDARAAAGRVAALESELSGMRRLGQGERGASIRLRELQRDAQVAQATYDAVLRRTNQLADADRLDDATARVITTAVAPVVPRPPGRKLVTMAGFAVSSMLATLLALMLERGRHQLRSTAEIRDELGLPTLAVVPRLGRRARRSSGHRQPIDDPPSAYGEAIRTAAFNLRLFEQIGEARTILVTSGLPREGKTTLALSLAAILVRRGRRALVIDFDLRRPGIHHQLGSSAPQGLTDHLEGGLPLDEVTYRDPATGIEFIPNRLPRGRPRGPARREAVTGVLAEARKTFDVVIVDAPPLAGGSDALLLAGLVDEVVVAVRWGGSRTAATRDGVTALRGADIEPAGVVLTMADRRHALAPRSRVRRLARWWNGLLRLGTTARAALPYPSQDRSPARGEVRS